MVNREELTALLERVRAATGPDRAIDRDIQKALDIGPNSFTQDEFNHWPLHVTASIDAALALTERVLPGWQVNLSAFGSQANASVGARGKFSEHHAPTPALAIIAATLSALIAQAETP